MLRRPPWKVPLLSWKRPCSSAKAASKEASAECLAYFHASCRHLYGGASVEASSYFCVSSLHHFSHGNFLSLLPWKLPPAPTTPMEYSTCRGLLSWKHIYLICRLHIYIYIYMYKFSLRSGMMSVALKTFVEIRIRLLMVRFELFHQMELRTAIGAIAQMYLLTTKHVFGQGNRSGTCR